jgi:hypothetical protein
LTQKRYPSGPALATLDEEDAGAAEGDGAKLQSATNVGLPSPCDAETLNRAIGNGGPSGQVRQR